MKLTCPSCHAIHSLEAFIQDAAGRELLGTLAKAPPGLFWPLSNYLGLFRSAKRALANDRALRLAREVLAIDADSGRLAAALAETVEAMRVKRDAGQIQPLKNHNYLLRVLESTPEGGHLVASEGPRVPAAPQARGRGPARMATAEEALAAWSAGDLLCAEVAGGLLALLARRKGNAPAAEEIDRTASAWLNALERARLGGDDEDLDRVRRAFSALLKKGGQWWPQPEDLVAELPRRKGQKKLAPPPPGREAIAEAGRQLGAIQERLADGMTLPKGKSEEDRREHRKKVLEQAQQIREEGP